MEKEGKVLKMNNELKTLMIMSGIARITAFVCITVAAIYFHKTGILWWYILPALMGGSLERKDGAE